MSDVKCARMRLDAAKRDVDALRIMQRSDENSDEVFGFHVRPQWCYQPSVSTLCGSPYRQASRMARTSLRWDVDAFSTNLAFRLA